MRFSSQIQKCSNWTTYQAEKVIVSATVLVVPTMQLRRAQYYWIIVMCVPSGQPASKWQRLGRYDFVGIVNDMFALYLLHSIDNSVISFLGNPPLSLYSPQDRAALLGKDTTWALSTVSSFDSKSLDVKGQEPCNANSMPNIGPRTLGAILLGYVAIGKPHM